jgi:hypothetical protein
MSCISSQRRQSWSLHLLQAPVYGTLVYYAARRDIEAQATDLAVSRPDETESALLDLVDDNLRPAKRPRHPKRLACASVFDCYNLTVNATPRCPQEHRGVICWCQRFRCHVPRILVLEERGGPPT